MLKSIKEVSTDALGASFCMENTKKLQKLLAFKGNPTLATYSEVVDLNDNIKKYHDAVSEHKKIVDTVEHLKGDKGIS